jgi:hypothetical protein
MPETWEGAITPGKRAWAVMLGTLFGMVLGSLFFSEGKMGILLGGILFSWLIARYIDEDYFKKWIIRSCQGVLIWLGIKVVKCFFGIRKLFLSTEKKIPEKTMVEMTASVSPFIMRFLIVKEFDESASRTKLKYIFSNWLIGVDAAGVALYEEAVVRPLAGAEASQNMEKIETELNREKDKTAKSEKEWGKFIAVLLNGKIGTDQERIDLLEDLKGRVEEMGYSSLAADVGQSTPSEKTVKTTIWREDMLEMYRPFGIIKDGDEVEILKEAVLKGGIVIAKGNVMKRENRK